MLQTRTRLVDRSSTLSAMLVARFHEQRPLRAGSLIVTIFGDSIAPRGGAVALGSLIRLAAPFGLNERLVRTSAARLADEGWLATRHSGRLGEYRLSRDGRERFAAATRRIYGVADRSWDGSFTLVILPSPGHEARQTARDLLGRAGFGEPAPGVFAHPGLSPADVRRLLQPSRETADALVLATRQDAPGTNARLLARGWDLDDLADRYTRFIAQFGPADAALRRGAVREPSAAFVLRTLLIHEYRRIQLRDPLLPAALLPADWVGTRAYELCRTVYDRVAIAADQHLTQTGATLDGPLPAAGPELFTRFGGLTREA